MSLLMLIAQNAVNYSKENAIALVAIPKGMTEAWRDPLRR
jgi:hypothetical protein